MTLQRESLQPLAQCLGEAFCLVRVLETDDEIVGPSNDDDITFRMAPYAGMAERRPRRLAFQVHLDYTFDRLRAQKLAQVDELLVPTQQRPVGACVRGSIYEVGGDLRSSVLGSTAGGTHNCEPDSGAARVRPEGVSIRRRRLCGATLERPGLERIRDLAAEGQIPNATCVVALIDRLAHRSEILSIAGESYRLKEATERAAKRAAARSGGRKSRTASR
jgi:hypothetical protein